MSEPKLLTGDNPQIAKADAPVQAYIAAMPGWKNDLGRRLDGLLTKWVAPRSRHWEQKAPSPETMRCQPCGDSFAQRTNQQ